jgi:hypothetical protein
MVNNETLSEERSERVVFDHVNCIHKRNRKCLAFVSPVHNFTQRINLSCPERSFLRMFFVIVVLRFCLQIGLDSMNTLHNNAYVANGLLHVHVNEG